MTTDAVPPHSQAEMSYAREAARSQQRLALAVAAGTIVAGSSAILWAAITATTGYQIGYMAIGVGLAVGLTVRHAGRGIDQSFAILGATLALLGCAAGNLLTGVAFIARDNQVSITQALSALDTQMALGVMQALFSPIDLLFYGIAVWEGYRLSCTTVQPVGAAAPARS